MPGQFLSRADQRGRTGQDDRTPTLLDECGIADELNRVAKTLFAVQQDRATMKWGAIPDGLRRSKGGQVLAAPAPFVLGPAFGESAEFQQGHAFALVGIGAVGVEPKGLFEVCGMLDRFVLIEQQATPRL